ncbi:MAG TPA: protoporphyrinogen oxidase, partial [Pyrinomonadaceae bacterium]|nr:protoporphyrinogen oxidase [Pyrinomonadaceae bacterium]
MPAKRVVIVGGGISGLAAAHRLLELGLARSQLTLVEGSGRLGGTLETQHRDGFLLERGPDSFISEKPEAVALAKRLGLESQLIQTNEENRRSFIVRNGRLRPVPEGFQLLAPSRVWPFITTDIFSVTGKLRIAAELLLPRENGKQDESLASFVRRRLGQEALERMAQPMVGGIYTADPETLSLRATLPRFLDMERDHRSLILAMLRQGRAQKSGTSGARYSLFLSFDRGMEVLVNALASRIPNVLLKTRIEEVGFDSGTWLLRTNSGSTLEANAICLAVPAYTAARLLRSVSARLASELHAIKYASTATINFAYPSSSIKHPLNGFGFVVP